MIVAVHRAGRGELAWAGYQGSPWLEVSAPRLSKADEFAEAIPNGAIVTGEVDEALATVLRGRVTIAELALEGRARSLAALGYRRLTDGETAEPALLRPIYLRPPAIGPQGTRATT
jgi:tRNA A37 threonylcarbamoyladenosine modification protein TsaB